ncbi:MAG: peptidoglycan recognition family protein, partial [Bacteroidota bacterium]
MEQKYGFTKLTLAEFKTWLKDLKVARTVLYVQQHHTSAPNYSHFNGENHFEKQRGMKNYHVHQRGWSDIGQHFTTFPDGTIVTGRSMERSPACIYGANAHSVCIEHLGNFDSGKDDMTDEHKKTAAGMTAALCERFNVPVNTDKIIYHHWYNLSTGARNNGTGGNKTCPGTNFFGGNKVADCQNNFLPLVREALNPGTNDGNTKPTKYVSVTADFLNIRTNPGASNPKVEGREPALLGSVLRIYEEKDGWLRISSSSSHWVSGKHTKDVRRAIVRVGSLNVGNSDDV